MKIKVAHVTQDPWDPYVTKMVFNGQLYIIDVLAKRMARSAPEASLTICKDDIFNYFSVEQQAQFEAVLKDVER